MAVIGQIPVALRRLMYTLFNQFIYVFVVVNVKAIRYYEEQGVLVHILG
jgi:hypothetical protein